MNKRKLYESIMMNVAKEVKKALNEAEMNESFWNKITRQGHSADEVLLKVVNIINEYINEVNPKAVWASKFSNVHLHISDITYIKNKPCILRQRAKDLFDDNAYGKLLKNKCIEDGNTYLVLVNASFKDHMNEKELKDLMDAILMPGSFTYFCIRGTKDSKHEKERAEARAKWEEQRRIEQEKKNAQRVKELRAEYEIQRKIDSEAAEEAARLDRENKEWW